MTTPISEEHAAFQRFLWALRGLTVAEARDRWALNQDGELIVKRYADPDRLPVTVDPGDDSYDDWIVCRVGWIGKPADLCDEWPAEGYGGLAQAVITADECVPPRGTSGPLIFADCPLPTVYEFWQFGEQNTPDAAQPELKAHHYDDPTVGDNAYAFGENDTSHITCEAPGSPSYGLSYACHLGATTGIQHSGKVACTAGTSYTFRVVHGGYSPTYRLRVRWFSTDGLALSQISTDTLFLTTTVSDGWITTEGTFTAPTGAVCSDIHKDNGSGSAVTVRFDVVEILEWPA